MYIFKQIVNHIIEFANDMKRHNSASYAASIAFFFFLSIIPALMFVCAITPYLPFTQNDVINNILILIPDNLDDAVKDLILNVYKAPHGLLPITAVATLWSAGYGIMGLIRGLNGILEEEDTRNYFILRGISTIYTFIMLVVILVTLSLVIFGESIFDKLSSFYPHLAVLFDCLTFFRGFLTWGILAVVFDLVYTFLPCRRQRLSLQIPGALISSLCWCIVTWGFTIFVDYFGGFSIYGNLASIMFLLFWLYACFNLLIFGAFFNKYYKPIFTVIVRHLFRLKYKRKEERKQKREAKSIDNTAELIENSNLEN